MTTVFILLAALNVFAAQPVAATAAPVSTSAPSAVTNSFISKKSRWQNQFQGPVQNLTISACSDKGCHYEFKGNSHSPCTDTGTFRFKNADQDEASATHHIGAKTCTFEFNLNESGSVEVEDSCVCNVATDSDLGGEYAKQP